MSIDQNSHARIVELSLAFTDSVKETHSFTDVFNALSMTVVSFAVNYVASNGGVVNHETINAELAKFAALTGTQADFLLSQVNIAGKLKEFEQFQQSQQSQH